MLKQAVWAYSFVLHVHVPPSPDVMGLPPGHQIQIKVEVKS